MNTLFKQVYLLFVISVMLLVTNPAKALTGIKGPYYATPAWDQTLPPGTRFILLSNFGDKAFLDRDTGLVWATNPLEWEGTVGEANVNACIVDAFGGQYGWRLPTFTEMLTLFQPLGDTEGVPYQGNNLYATTIGMPSFIHYPPTGFGGGQTHLLTSSNNSTFRVLENQTETDWNIYNVVGGNDTLTHSYFWCVRGPGGK